MLTKLLKRQTCAECRKCCYFDRYDFWDTPMLSEANCRQILEILPETKFISKGRESFLFRVDALDENDMFACPALDPEKGCLLGEDKPFDCAVFPFRVMELEGRRVIALSPVCEAVTSMSVSKLLGALKDELAHSIFAYAAAHPDVVHPYDDLYPILLWEPRQF